MNTIERHKEQIAKIVKFAGKAKFTSAENLQLAAGRKRRGLPVQLKRMGLIVSCDLTPSQTIFGLSKKGAILAGVEKFDIHKVGVSRVQHALIAQFETLNSLETFGIVDYEFEPQNHSKDFRPDSLWDIKDGRELNVEVELTGKSLSDGDMDRFFRKLISRETLVVFNDQALLTRYLKQAEKYLENGIPDWQKIDGEWFNTGGIISVPKERFDRVYFRMHRSMMKCNLNFLLFGMHIDWSATVPD